MKNRVGLGTFPLASVFSKISKDEAKRVAHEFISAGGYYIDTAPMYGFGEVESLLGEVLKDFSRDQYYVVTKCGYIDVEGKTFQTIEKSGKYDDVLRECDRSLKRLGVDYIDLYFMHSPDPNTPIDETLRAMEKLQENGKIKEIGVSNVNVEELKEYNKTGKVKFVQNRFSLINRSINGELKNYMLENDIKLVPYQVIDRGQLTGSVIEGMDLKDGDLRVGRSDWLPEKYNVIADWSKENLQPIAKKLNITLGQLSMAWALHQPYMGFLIVGVTNTEYIPINLKADSIKLSPEVLAEIDDAYAQLEQKIQSDFGVSVREFRGLNEKYY
jgi:aryl-alcohol dehydrogenase-like predicted oxidoreductase